MPDHIPLELLETFIRNVVTDLVHRYDQMQRFVATQHADRPIVSIACGQQVTLSLRI